VYDVLGGLVCSYLFEGLTREDVEPLAASARTRELVRGEYLCHLGEPAHELYVVVSGQLKTSVVDADGRELIHQVHGPGMTVGEPGFFAVEQTRIVEVIAVAPSVVIRLGRRELVPFMQRHVSVKDRALEGLASATRWQTTMISSLLSRPLSDRLLLVLLELLDSGPDRRTGPAVTSKVSQSTLASMLGVSRENVNRALAALAVEGKVRQDNGRYLLVDEPRLRRELARDWPLARRRDQPSGQDPAPQCHGLSRQR